MELLEDDPPERLSRFNSDLHLFDSPIPQVCWSPQSRAAIISATTAEDPIGSPKRHPKHSAFPRDLNDNLINMQRQDPSRYTPKTVYNPGYTNMEHGNTVATDHKPPIPGVGGGSSPAGGALSPAGKYPPSPAYSQSAVMDMHHRALLASRAAHGSPTRTVPSSSNQGDVGSVPAPKPGPQLVPKAGGSNYSSPRSSIGSYDSKGSSPRTSLVNPPPPPPYDFQRHGSPLPSNLASPRSSVSATSLDSKHSSPRASITGISNALLYDKAPSPRGSVANDKYWSQNEHQMINNYSDGHLPARQAGMRTTPLSLLDRYNEPAPPPPYDPRMMKGGAQISPQVSPSHAINNYHNSNSPSPALGRSTRGNIPVAVVHTSSGGGPAGQMIMSNQHQQRSSPQSTPNSQSPVHQQAKVANITNRLPGLNYDVVKKGQDSEAERKVAALTRQLESELGMTGSPSSLRKQQSPGGIMDTIPIKPPPPYHGPHNTEAFSTSYNPPSYSTPKTADQQSTPSSLSSTPSSSRLNLSNNMKSPLPYQVTPPQPVGPTEAEKKVEALTAALESQFDQHPQGEYFGKSQLAACNTPSSKLDEYTKSFQQDAPLLDLIFRYANNFGLILKIM